MKRICSCLIACIVVVQLYAQNLQQYYRKADGKVGKELYDSLRVVITTNHSVVSYDQLWESYAATDVDADGYIMDMYSNCNFKHLGKKCGQYSGECSCYNREHSIPQSWFSKQAPMKSDIVHVIPTDGYVNNRRSSYPLGEVRSATYTSHNGSKVGDSESGYSGTVFEPIDEYKGDFARIYFYMATRYANVCGNWSGGVFASKANLGLNSYFKNLYLKWHRQDPVSEKEKKRNTGIYSVQKNRNPFVDHPELVEHIWGNKTGDAWVMSESGLEEVPMVGDSIKEELKDVVRCFYIQEGEGFYCPSDALPNGIYTYEVFNLVGEKLLQSTVEVRSEHFYVDVAALRSGFYVCSMSIGNGKKKVMKVLINNR